MPNTLHTDDFNRADSTGLGGAPFNWNTPSGTVNIVSNVAVPSPSSDSECVSTVSIPDNDNVFCQGEITVVGTTVGVGPGLIARKTSGEAYRVVVSEYAGGVNIEFARVEPSYAVQWRRTAAWVNGDLLRMQVIGKTFSVFWNGIQLGADHTINDTWNGTLTMGIASSSTFTSGSIDNWQMGVAMGTIIRPQRSRHPKPILRQSVRRR